MMGRLLKSKNKRKLKMIRKIISILLVLGIVCGQDYDSNTGKPKETSGNEEKVSRLDGILSFKNLNPKLIVQLNNFMKKTNSEIGTLAAKIIDVKEIVDSNIVKVKTKEPLDDENFLKSENFLEQVI